MSRSLLSLAVGAVVGAWQGFWVAFVGIPAFIVTLAGMLLFRGLTLVLLTGGTIGGLPDGFTAIGAGWLPPFARRRRQLDVLTLALGAVASVPGSVVQQLQHPRDRSRRLELPREVAWSFWAKIVVACVAIMAPVLHARGLQRNARSC